MLTTSHHVHRQVANITSQADGAAVVSYMCVVFATALSQAVLPNCSRTNHRSHSVTTISLSRFLLSLREVAFRSDVFSSQAEGEPSGEHAPSLEFSRVIGRLGNAVSSEILGLDEEYLDEDVEIEDTDAIPTTAVSDIELEPVGRPGAA